MARHFGILVALPFTCLSAHAADLVFQNRLINEILINDNTVKISVEASRICGVPADPSGPPRTPPCRTSYQFAVLPESPNKSAMLQLLVAAYANKLPLTVSMDKVQGTMTIIGVEGLAR